MIRRDRLAVLVMAVMLAGCAVDDSGPIRSVWRNDAEKTHFGHVLYVTDREPIKTSYGTEFSTRWAGTPSCGMAFTQVPTATAPGETEFYGFMSSVSPKACEKDGRKLGGVIAFIEEWMKRDGCASVFLFVHGFHTSFSGAIPRASQVAHDAGAGCIIAFSWSAEVDVDRYVADLEHSDYAQPLLAELLRELSESGLRLNIVAHSLGGRLVLMTLAGMAEDREPVKSSFVDELVLAAPDIGADPKNNDFLVLMGKAAPLVKRTTVYVSRYDSVLEISRREHGGIPRLGNLADPGYRPSDAHIVDVVDVSQSVADRLDHSYYAMSRDVLADMAAVLRGVPAETRLKTDPPTLTCPSACGPGYAVKTTYGHGPRFTTRFIFDVLPIIPLVR